MTTKDPWQIEFYRTNDGKSPVLEFIDELPAKDRAKVINHLKLLAHVAFEVQS